LYLVVSFFLFSYYLLLTSLLSFPTRRSSDLDFSTGGTANEVSVKVSGPSTEAIEDTVKSVEKEIAKVSGVENVSSNLSESYEQYDIEVDQNKATKLGLSAGQIAMTLNQTTQDKVVTKLNDDGKSID